MTRDNLVTVAMIVFFAAMLIFAAKAMLTNDSSRDAKAAPNHIASEASTGSEQPGDTPVSSEPIAGDASRIWTSEEMQRAVPYPMPILQGNGPTSVGGQDTVDGPPTGAEGGTSIKP